jgi:CRP/FNR family cyclic AMP-dependent transcriptional regulator
VVDRRESIQRAGFARHLGPEAIAALAQIGHEQRLERGTVITLEGEPAEAMYLVAAGRVKIARYSLEGREQIMYTAGPGDHFNTVPIFDGGRCPATTEAMEPTTLIVLHRQDILGLLPHYPELSTAFLKEFAGRLRMLVGLVEDLALKTVHGRLAGLLLHQAETSEHVEAPRPMSQAEMAANLGTVREMISRTLKSFEAAGLIAIERGSIRIVDREGLQSRIES